MISRSGIITTILAFLVTASTTIITTVSSYSSGAGGCGGGDVAVRGLHTNTIFRRTVRSRTFDEKGIVLKVNNATVLSGARITTKVLKDFYNTLEVTGPNMKGVLMRVSKVTPVAGDNGLLQVVPGSRTTKVASVCKQPVVGITHVSSTTQQSYNGTIFSNLTTPLISLEITVVFKNRFFQGSEHAYGRFFLDFLDCGSVRC
jgi:hypothetical protein